MAEWIDALRRLAEDPAQNAAAIGTGVAIVVLFVVILVLLLLAVALPASRAAVTADTDEGGRRRRVPQWLSVLLVALLVVALAASALVLWYHDTSSNDYCTKTCHAMAVATETWAISAHADVTCTRCHEGRKWKSFPRGVATRAHSLILQATGSPARGDCVPVDICLSCHGSVMSRTVVGRNGEPFKHSTIASDDLDCRECHGLQGHTPARP